MRIPMITSYSNKTIHAIKVPRVVLKGIFIITFLLKSSSIILCRLSSKSCSISCMHKSYVILNKVCVSLISSICLSIPSYSTIVMLSSSYSRSTIIRFVCKLTHYIIICSITVAISV
nr:MAG TPA: hypothetical protein [Bacteriophage sp.]